MLGTALGVTEFTPEPNDWYAVTIIRVHDGYAFAAFDDYGDEVFISFSSIRVDARGHRCIHEGDEALVRLEENQRQRPAWRTRTCRWQASECSTTAPRVYTDDWEPATVDNWNVSGRAGMVRRKCGCRIKVLLKARDEMDLNHGDAVMISGFATDERNPGLSVARKIRVVDMEEEK